MYLNKSLHTGMSFVGHKCLHFNVYSPTALALFLHEHLHSNTKCSQPHSYKTTMCIFSNLFSSMYADRKAAYSVACMDFSVLDPSCLPIVMAIYFCSHTKSGWCSDSTWKKSVEVSYSRCCWSKICCTCSLLTMKVRFTQGKPFLNQLERTSSTQRNRQHDMALRETPLPFSHNPADL